MPRAESGTAPPSRRGQHATTCYVFRFRQKFGGPGFRRKLILNNNLRLFPPWLSWEAPVGLTLCRYRSYVDMIHVVDFEKTAFSTPFRGVLAPSGLQISAEGGRASRSLVPGKPGWAPMSTWPLFSHPTPHAPRPTPHTPPAGSGRARTLPPWYCLTPTAELPKTERGPISTSGPSICSMSQNQAIRADKSIRFPPLVAVGP